MKISAQEVFNCTPDEYWNFFFDEDARRPNEVDGCGAVSYRVVSKEVKAGKVVLRAELQEKNDAPAAVRKLFGETVGMVQQVEWKEGSDTAQIELIPEKMANRIKMRGTLRTQPVGDGKCKVVVDYDVEVKIFGVGGMLEKSMAKDIPIRHRKAAEHFNRTLVST